MSATATCRAGGDGWDVGEAAPQGAGRPQHGGERRLTRARELSEADEDLGLSWR